MNKKNRDANSAKANPKHKSPKETPQKTARIHMMEWITQITATLVVIIGIIATVLALSSRHRDMALWLYCITCCLVMIGLFAWIQDRFWKGDAAAKSVAIDSPRFGLSDEKFVFVLGGNMVPFSRSDLVASPRILKTGDGPNPISLSLKDDKLVFSANLYLGEDFKTIAIKESKINEYPPGFDLNHNSDWTAAEIVNEKGIPVLQLIYSQPTRLEFKGVFVDSDRVVVADDRGMRFDSWSTAKKPIKYKIAPLFKYPAWKYPGQYADPKPPIMVNLSSPSAGEIADALSPLRATSPDFANSVIGQKVRWALTFQSNTVQNGEPIMFFVSLEEKKSLQVWVKGSPPLPPETDMFDHLIVEGTIESANFALIVLSGKSIEIDPR